VPLEEVLPELEDVEPVPSFELPADPDEEPLPYVVTPPPAFGPELLEPAVDAAELASLLP